MTSLQDIIQTLESFAPSQFQEDYDNSGLIVGQRSSNIRKLLISLDITEDVLKEAIEQNCQLIVAHHPIIFKSLKSLTGSNYVERVVTTSIKNDIALYAIHTNLDNVYQGVNFKLAQKIGLTDVKILAPKKRTLMKLVTFVPLDHTDNVLRALGEAGAGQIGEYKNCSFQVKGTGTFEPTDLADPFIGEANQLEKVPENRIEVVFPIHLESRLLQALRESHPYQEIAYYLQTIENQNQEVGSGAIGMLTEPIAPLHFLQMLKSRLNLNVIRHSKILPKSIQKVALCGGTGSFLLPKAIQQQADVFVSADFKYHEFFDADQKILITDIGHYESEHWTIELLHEILEKDFKDLSILKTKVNTNPIGYY
jgi:dinuclear metal center YbgI/SA1388 family protein